MKGFRVHQDMIVGLSHDLQFVTLRLDDNRDVLLNSDEARLLMWCIESLLKWQQSIPEFQKWEAAVREDR